MDVVEGGCRSGGGDRSDSGSSRRNTAHGLQALWLTRTHIALIGTSQRGGVRTSIRSIGKCYIHCGPRTSRCSVDNGVKKSVIMVCRSVHNDFFFSHTKKH